MALITVEKVLGDWYLNYYIDKGLKEFFFVSINRAMLVQSSQIIPASKILFKGVFFYILLFNCDVDYALQSPKIIKKGCDYIIFTSVSKIKQISLFFLLLK